MTISLTDYTHTAAQHGWGAGWPSCSGAKAAGTAVVQTARSKVRVSVHKRIARLVLLLMDETELRGYLFRAGVCGGYNCRAISGTSSASNHSWGLAVDLNWDKNPYQEPRRTDMPDWMPALWSRYGFAWGGNYNRNGLTGPADSMHYEFMGSPEDADAMTALVLVELAAGVPAAVSHLTLLEDDAMASIPICPDSGGRFHHAVGAEAGGGSQVASSGWITAGSTYGGTTWTIAALGATGTVIAYWKDVRTGNNTSWAQKLPDGTRAITLEGIADNSGTRPWASTWCLT